MKPDDGHEGTSQPSKGSRQSKRQAPSRGKPIIVGVGASAGGIAALQAWFEAVPTDLGVAYVIVVHLSPEYRSELASILGKRTKMPVTEVKDRAQLERDHVYVIPPDRRLEISDNEVVARQFDEPRGSRSPIDDFFRSLAGTHGDGFAVLLSGGGSDGSVGLKSIKEHGGVILVQDPREAEFDSMPQNAIATRLADVVLPVRKLAQRFAKLARDRATVTLLAEQLDTQQAAALDEIFSLLRARTGHDFARYKRSTLQRRLARRLQVSGRPKLSEYLQYLRQNAEEVQALFDDLLISVTTFFRDPKAFAALAETVVPKLFDDIREDEGLRLWVPSCATGEEVYSLVMLLLGEAGRRDVQVPIKVFGSDLDEGVLATAREGRYPEAIAADVSEQRLQRFFTKEGSHYRVRPEVRDCALFAAHSMLRDPPFSRLDLISCRNPMIYLERDLQRHVLGIFHYALRPRGYLFLGSSESADGSGLFGIIDKEHRIFQSLDHKTEQALELSSLLLATPAAKTHRAPTKATKQEQAATATLHREALEALAPPSILVDEGLAVVHLSETAGRFLQHPAGQITDDVTRLVRPELQQFLRSALFRAFEKHSATLSPPMPVSYDGLNRKVCVSVQPRLEGKDKARRALVLFLEGDEMEDRGDERAGSTELAQSHQLREELRSSHEQLQLTRENYDSTLEELRAANEELQSVNEEYRSTMEELETSKEELQSINEELQTVNAELRNKLEEISRAHSDLQNLIAATDLGTLFLDLSLRIKRFTPRLGDLFNITASDVGRPITDFTHRLDYAELVDDARRLIDQLAPFEKEVGGHHGGWYLARFRPYRTVDNKIEGVVITFVDISERKAAEKALANSRAQLAHELEIMRRLHGMTMQTVSADNLRSALAEILAAGIELQSADFGAIQLRSAEDGINELFVHHGVAGRRLAALEEASLDPDSATATALHRRERAVIEDVLEANVSERYRRLAVTAGYRAVQATPLISNKRQLLGVLVTHFREPRKLSISEARLLDVLGRYAANLLERLQTEAQLKDLNDRLEHRVRERTERVLEFEGRFRALVEASAQMVWTTNVQGRIVEDSPSWRAFTGQAPEQFLEEGWLQALHPEDRQYVATKWRHCVESQHPFDGEFRIHHANSDSFRWVHIRSVPLRTENGTVGGWVAMGTDVTESKRSATQLRTMAATLTLAEEKERRRIAHILHDDLQQLLFGIQLRVKSLVKSAKMGKANSLAEDAEQAVHWLGDAIDKTRGLSMDLSPPFLEEDEDFGSAVRWLAQRMREVTGLQAKVRVPSDLPPINTDTRVRLFQILRELLFNVAKHAAADKVSVDIGTSDGELRVVVTDSGKGFDVAATMAKHNAGLGLFNIRDRLSFFGGRMDIESAPDKGTVVTISVPLDRIGQGSE